jgi:C4-dicarboxylate-specific signal transduction histidine kinase
VNVVQTEISDRGRRVEPPGRILKPFFTTKEAWVGMGLAVCCSIVAAQGGRLRADKKQPHGARSIFTLLVEAKAVP